MKINVIITAYPDRLYPRRFFVITPISDKSVMALLLRYLCDIGGYPACAANAADTVDLEYFHDFLHTTLFTTFV